MKNRIALHTEPLKNVVTSLVFSLTSLFLMLTLILSINKDSIQLNSLLQSNYNYSVLMQDNVQKDNYYKFNASIEFALADDSQASLNADVIMQSQGSLYTDLVYWNADTLDSSCVAVSQNLAMLYGLHIGDRIYSKHIVNGKKCEYSIVQIVPEIVNVRTSEGVNNNDGIIIMGFDELYVENITHSNIVFAKDKINNLAAIGTLENVVYRDDEIITSIKNVIPYIAIISICAIALTFVFVTSLTQYVSYSFRRLVMLGFEKRQLNRAYYRYVYGAGIVSIVVSFALSNIVFLQVGFSAVKFFLLMFVPIIELITFNIDSTILNKRLWRK